MATRFAGAYKVAVVNPVPVGTGLTDFGANITLIPDVSVDTQNNNSYIDPSAGSPIANWPGSLPHGSITFGVLTKAATAFFTLGTQCTLTITVPQMGNCAGQNYSYTIHTSAEWTRPSKPRPVPDTTLDYRPPDLRLNGQPFYFQPQEKKEPMRGLYQVFIVDPGTGSVNVQDVVARDESTAKVKALSAFYPSNKKDLDDYDVIVRRLGDVRNKTAKDAAAKALEQMPKPSPIDDLATAMAAELASDTDKLAGSLKSEMQQVGTETMSKADYLAYVHRNWADPSFRTSLLKQIGNKPFLDLAQDVVAAHGHPDIPPPLALGGMIQAPTVNSGMVPPMPTQPNPGG